MNLALIGTGRMGKTVEAVAAERNHEVVARFDSERPLLDESDPAVLNDAMVCIDFSTPNVALDHLHRYALWGVDAVVGTTGWFDEIETVRDWVEEGQNAVLYAPNFSIGIALLERALRGMLPLLNKLDDYDSWIHEAHHTGKVDSPSGTALRLAEQLIDGLDRKGRIETETQHGTIDADALHVTSTRAGQVFGEHTVSFDSSVDRITLAHSAKDRRAFALGAIRAAEWIPGRKGLFTLDDWIESVINRQ